ncbi:hypothetical protein [Spirosoma areae]
MEESTMSQKVARTSTIQFSLVPEFSWWKSSDGTRLMCVIEVHGRGQGNDFVNTEVAIVEVGIMAKKRVPYQKFSELIHQGKLVQVSFVNTAPLVQSFTHRMNPF